MIEIERRALLDEDQYIQAVEYLDKKGAKWQENKRLMMDFSEEIKNRNTTVMVRTNNGLVELVVKTGGIADAVRQEASIQISSSLEAALETLALLGYTKASYGLRSMKTCEIDGVEYSLRKVLDHKDLTKVLAVNFEVELRREGSAEELDEILNDMGLTALTKDETKALFEKFHAEANGVFEYSQESLKELDKVLSDF